MTLSITGGQAMMTADLGRALQNMAAKAKQQFQEKGSLEGFAEEYTSTSAEGSVTVKISAVAAALYDKSAGPDDHLLRYQLSSKMPDGEIGGASSDGSSLTIKSVEDIDGKSREIFDIYDDLKWATVINGTPEELAAYDAAEMAKLRAQPGFVELQATGANAAPTAAPAAMPQAVARSSSPSVEKAKAANESANQLVAKLQAFLDGMLGRSKAAQSGAAEQSENRQQEKAALNQFLNRVNTTA